MRLNKNWQCPNCGRSCNPWVVSRDESDQTRLLLECSLCGEKSMHIDHDGPPFMGTAEVAEAFGVTRQAVRNWVVRNRTHLPQPVARLRMGPIWRTIDILPAAKRYKEGCQGCQKA